MTRNAARPRIFHTTYFATSNSEGNRSWAVPFAGIIRSALLCFGLRYSAAAADTDISANVQVGLSNNMQDLTQSPAGGFKSSFDGAFAGCVLVGRIETAASNASNQWLYMEVLVPVSVAQVVGHYWTVGTVGTLIGFVTLELEAA